MIQVIRPRKAMPTLRNSDCHRSRQKNGCFSKRNFETSVAGMLLAVVFAVTPTTWATSGKASDKIESAKIQAKIRQLTEAVENLQEDIVEEALGAKEKLLFLKADQVLRELANMEKLMRQSASTRASIYLHFDKVDGMVGALRQKSTEIASKYPLVVRAIDRISLLTDDLHFIVSQGDGSEKRVRQAIGRQARAMSEVAKKLAGTAQYALEDSPAHRQLVADANQLAATSKDLEKVVGSPVDLDKCKSEFSRLNDAWRQLVRRISVLPPMENIYLLRGALRADAIHERLFRMLEIKGDRSYVTIRI